MVSALAGFASAIAKERQIYTGRVGAPTMAAVYPVAGDGSEGQRWKLDVFPEPDDDYGVLGQYYSNPYQITGLKPYPLGGQYSSVARMRPSARRAS